MSTFTCMQIVLMGGMLATGASIPFAERHRLISAMSLSVIGLFFQRRRELQEYKKQVQHTQISEAETGTVQSQIETGPPVPARMFQWILLIPACTYIVANSLAGIGLLYVNASVFIMMRGSIVLFTGILSKVFLKRELNATQWLGIVAVMIGLLLAGCSSLFKSQTHKTNGGGTLSGICMILVSQMVTSGQMIFEEEELASITSYWNEGGVWISFAVFPVHRTLIDACRTVVVWGVGLIVYYTFDKNFGEPFDRSYGILQLHGFIFLVIGTAMYNQLIDIRHFVYFCTLTSKNVKVGHNDTGHQGNLHDIVAVTKM